MTDQIDPWSMTDAEAEQMYGQPNAVDPLDAQDEWDAEMPSFDDGRSDLPTFATEPDVGLAGGAPFDVDATQPVLPSFAADSSQVSLPTFSGNAAVLPRDPVFEVDAGPSTAPTVQPQSLESTTPAPAPSAPQSTRPARAPRPAPPWEAAQPHPAHDVQLPVPLALPDDAPAEPPWRTAAPPVEAPPADVSPFVAPVANTPQVADAEFERRVPPVADQRWDDRDRRRSAHSESSDFVEHAPQPVPPPPPMTEVVARPPARAVSQPRPTPSPIPIPVPIAKPDSRVVDEPALVKNPEKGLSGVRRRMGRKLGGKQLPPEQLTMNLKKPLPRPAVVAVVQHTGGVGKSTLTAAVGQQLATHRRDRVIAIDAALAAGGLSQRLPVQNESTIQTLLANLGSVRRWSDAREHTSQGRTGLELLTSGNSIADEAVLTAEGYRRVIDVLTTNDTYNLLVVDCDAGVTGELMDAVLESADVVMVPASGRDGVSGAVVTMNRLMYLADKYPHRSDHYQRLISNAVVVLNHISPKSILRDDEVGAMFREKVGVREVVSVPFDPTLKDGSEVDIVLADKRTASALLQLASEIVTSLRRAL